MKSQGVSPKTILSQNHTIFSGHGHSHGDVALPTEDGIVATARGFLVVLALSIHDLFEGVALGVARSLPFLDLR